MRKRIFVILLMLTMALTMLPAIAFANGEDSGAATECTCTEACNIENHPYAEDGACPVCSSYTTYTIGKTTYYNMGYLNCQHLKETVYVNSETGDDGNSGDSESPVANLQMALYKLKPGGTIIIQSETVTSFSPEPQAWRGIIKDNFIIDRAVTIEAEEGVTPEYAGKMTTAISGTFGTSSGTPFVPGNFNWSVPNTSSFLEEGATAARWYNNPSGTVTLDGIYFTNTGGNIIAQYNGSSDLSEFDLVIKNCTINSGSAIQFEGPIRSITIEETEFTVPADGGYAGSYVVWPRNYESLSITGCNFNGQGRVRGAIHVGSGYNDPQAFISNNTEVSTMEALGILNGRTTDAFAPDAFITRAEFAAICARFDTGRAEGDSNLTDIAGHWAEAEIKRAAALGWVAGYPDGTFRPNSNITRAEAMTIINRVLQRLPQDEGDLLTDMTIWPDNNPTDWYYLAIQEATNSHEFVRKSDGIHERWTKCIADPDWTQY